jgi:hypothetical protein
MGPGRGALRPGGALELLRRLLSSLLLPTILLIAVPASLYVPYV